MEKIKPIISVKEARKLLEIPDENITDEELTELILQQEQMIRFIFKKYRVHKNTMV